MKCCPNCGKELTKDGFCSNCKSSPTLPGMKINVTKIKDNNETVDEKTDNISTPKTKDSNETKNYIYSTIFAIIGFIIGIVSIVLAIHFSPSSKDGLDKIFGGVPMVPIFLLCLFGTVFSLAGLGIRKNNAIILFAGVGVFLNVASIVLCFTSCPF